VVYVLAAYKKTVGCASFAMICPCLVVWVTNKKRCMHKATMHRDGSYNLFRQVDNWTQ